jgi:YVTN family beta-propeller protein
MAVFLGSLLSPFAQEHRECAMRSILALTAAGLLTAALMVIPAGVALAGTAPAISPATDPTAWVGSANSDSAPVITPVNTAAGTPITVGCPYSGGCLTYAVAVSPNGGMAYALVASVDQPAPSQGTVYPVNLSTDAVGTGLTVGQIGPYTSTIAITPDGSTAYVTNSAGDTVVPVNLGTWKAGPAITVGSDPSSIAFSPDGGTAYVTNSGGDTITPIKVSTNTAQTPITVGSGPDAIAIAPDGTTAYVANENDSTVSPVSLTTGTAGPPIALPAGSYPDAITIIPNGATVYVANQFGADPGSVSPISTATNTAGPPITLPSGWWGYADPYALAASPNGSAVYAVDWGNGQTDPISTATGTVGTPVVTGQEPSDLAFSPGWQLQATVPSASSGTGPALCALNGTLYAAFTTASGGIDYAVQTASGWSAPQPVTGAATSWAPALADNNGHLQAYWTNSSTNQIQYATLGASGWSAPATVSGSWGAAGTNAGPAVAVNGAQILVAWKGTSSGDLWYATSTGSGWNAQVNTGQATSYAPAVAPLPSAAVPFAFAWTTASGSIDVGTLTISGFGADGTVPSAGTSAAPALALAGSGNAGTLYLAWKGRTNNEIGYEAVYDLPDAALTPAYWTAQEFEPQASTLNTPALAASGYVLYAGWTGRTTSELFYAGTENPY